MMSDGRSQSFHALEVDRSSQFDMALPVKQNALSHHGGLDPIVTKRLEDGSPVQEFRPVQDQSYRDSLPVEGLPKYA